MQASPQRRLLRPVPTCKARKSAHLSRQEISGLGGLLVAISVFLSHSLAAAETRPLHKLDPEMLKARLAADARAVSIFRHGLADCVTTARSQPRLFPSETASDPPLLIDAEKETVRALWRSYLDYQLALDSLLQYHAGFHRLKGMAREDSFLINHAAFVAQYRFALEFIELAERNRRLDTVLNEPAPELGLPADTYAAAKFRFLNVIRASDFAARNVILGRMHGEYAVGLRAGIDEDTARIWQFGRGSGEALTARNALRIVQRTGQTAWFPVQSGVAEWMGDTKVRRAGRCLITPAQIEQLHQRLEPGDVLLTRREWYLSNIGLPGFWPHAALFIGTPEERRRLFGTETVRSWVRSQGEASGDFETLLAARAPDAYGRSQTAQEQGHIPRIIEAMSEGVSLTTLEHCADADSVAVLRPRLPATERALAVLRAFRYVGRPYDFDFDFATDSALVCTEVIYKAYEPSAGMRGLDLPLVDMLGRKVTPANEIARQFDAQSWTGEAQFEFVAFLDGHEASGAAIEASLEEFRRSWRRPKWHVLAQEKR